MNKQISCVIIVFFMWVNNNYGMLLRLIKTRPSFSLQRIVSKRFFQSPTTKDISLHLAVKRNECKQIEYALSKNSNAVNYGDAGGFFPLHYAQSLYSTEMLLDAGADVNAGNQLGETPLYTVPAYVSRLLLLNGADINVLSKRTIFISNSYGYLPLTPLRNVVLHADIDKFNHYRDHIISIPEYYILFAIAKIYGDSMVDFPSLYCKQKQHNILEIQKHIINILSKDF